MSMKAFTVERFLPWWATPALPWTQGKAAHETITIIREIVGSKVSNSRLLGKS
jgi:hypothetical protein